ncbi:MAG TPA: hypothetical protein VMF88_03385 [Bacteroidota bacterium]|nr:hypothetical protein [Bacteroidota bacterium]
MQNKIDRKTVLLIALTFAAVVLTFIRERLSTPEPAADITAPEQRLPLGEISSIVDTTLKRMMLPSEKIKHAAISIGGVPGVREEVRIRVAPNFEVLRALAALTDSLRRFNVTLASTENLKEKTSTIHCSFDKHIFESIIIAREEPQKGARSSLRKNQKGMPRKPRR